MRLNDAALGHKCCFKIIITLVLNFNSIDLMAERPCNEMCCVCGRLIARWGKLGIELRCKRCKRLMVVRFEAISPKVLARTCPPGDPANK
jgi:hypothetical protein